MPHNTNKDEEFNIILRIPGEADDGFRITKLPESEARTQIDNAFAEYEREKEIQFEKPTLEKIKEQRRDAPELPATKRDKVMIRGGR